jgi:hypothetical protein
VCVCVPHAVAFGENRHESQESPKESREHQEIERTGVEQKHPVPVESRIIDPV